MMNIVRDGQKSIWNLLYAPFLIIRMRIRDSYWPLPLLSLADGHTT